MSYTGVVHDDPVVVIDNGSQTIRAGMAGDEMPSTVFESTVGEEKPEYLEKDAPIRTFIGSEVQSQRELLSLRHPVEGGVITNWDDIEMVWDRAYEKINVSPKDLPVLMSDSPLAPRSNREKMCEFLFETYQVPFANVSLSGLLSLYASGRGSGISLDSGHGQTSIIPIVEGVTFPHAIARGKVAGRNLTDYLVRLLAERGHLFSSSKDWYMIQELREKNASFAPSSEYLYRDEQRMRQEPRCKGGLKAYRLPDGRTIKVEEDLLQTHEAMFDPSVLGHQPEDGLHHLIFNTVQNIDIDCRSILMANIVLSGGNTLIDGMQTRLAKELDILRAEKNGTGWRGRAICRASENRENACWIGGSIFGSLSLFPLNSVIKYEWEEHGPAIVYRRWKYM